MAWRRAKSIVVATGILTMGVLGMRGTWVAEEAFAQSATPARIVGNSIVVESNGPMYVVVATLRPGAKGPVDSQSSLTIDRNLVQKLVVHRAEPLQICEETCLPCKPAASCGFPPPPPPPVFQSGQMYLRLVWPGKP